MQFTVAYEDGIWSFTVVSVEDESEYREEFDIDNLEDAQAAAQDLIEEIKAFTEDDELDGLFGVKIP